jgi:hypothetical protein
MRNASGFIAAPVLVIAVIIAGLLAGGSWWYATTRSETINQESYLACGCGCCSGVEPRTQCLYADRGESLEEVIARDQATKRDPSCPFSGCSFPVRYEYCEGTGSVNTENTYVFSGNVNSSLSSCKAITDAAACKTRADCIAIDKCDCITQEERDRKCNTNTEIICDCFMGGFERCEALTCPATNTNTSSGVNGNTNAEPDATADWKTYTNNAYGYTLRYPNEYTVTEAANSYHGGVTFLRDTPNDPARNVNGFIMPDRREVTVSVIETSPLSQFAGSADYQQYYQWVRSSFTNDPPSGYYDRETIKLGSNTFIRFTVASGVDSVYEYFLQHGDLTFSFYESVLTSSATAHAENQQLLTTFSFTE